MEPGNKAQPRLAVSLYPDDETRLMKLKHHLEAKESKHLSISEVVRRAILYMAEHEGI